MPRQVRGLEALSVELFLEVNELLEYRERLLHDLPSSPVFLA